MKKIYILDTNVLLYDPHALNAFKDNEIIIPLVVLDELDKKKQGADETAKHARMVIRSLDKMRLEGNIQNGVPTTAGGLVRVELNHQDKCPQDLDPSRIDNRLISIALGVMEDEANGKKRKVRLITKDINLRVKCDALGVPTEDYIADSVVENPNMIYEGIRNISLDGMLVNKLHAGEDICSSDGHKFREFYPNQYIHVSDKENSKHTCMAKYNKDKQCIAKITPHSATWGIQSRNMEQAFALDALFDPNIKLVTIIGLAGSGKTLLAAVAGISQLIDTNMYKKLIMTRPVQPMGRDIGFLPGDIDDKMRPWMAPLQDNLELIFSHKGMSYLDMQREAGQIEIEALTYIRGRSIPNSFIIVDECQNLTLHEIKTVITRIGEGSKLVLTGDIMQIDNPFIDSVDNGLSCVVEKFKANSIAAHVTLHKGERSELASLAAELL
jgi:PhoH-like ATPase